MLVSDTLSIGHLCDLCLYVVRSNYTEKNILDFINDINKDKKFLNIGLVLNGVGKGSKYEYNYKYRYGYGYNYNYGYGYGYSSDESEDEKV